MSVEIKLHGTYGTIKRVVGYIDGREIISISNQIGGGKDFNVCSSTCLPSDLTSAKEYLDCMNRTFKEVQRITSGECNCDPEGMWHCVYCEARSK